MAKKTRLDKFLCDSLNMTRKEAKESVKKGKVVVNGEAIKKPEYKVDAEQDQVEFDHKLIQFEQFHYLMLHKPQGVVSAKVSGQFGENEIARFKEGLDIGNGEKSKQARLQILKADVQESEVLITIMEGKFHQVKRMVKAVGSEVLYLKRLSMGSLKLDEELKLGEYRRLTKAELQELKEHRR